LRDSASDVSPIRFTTGTGGPSIFGGFAPVTGCQENMYVPKMGNSASIAQADRQHRYATIPAVCWVGLNENDASVF
jgi:hypothetical protein